MDIYIQFKTTDEIINKKTFKFSGTITVREMLNSFLSQTNSKMTLDPQKIVFQYGAFILNNNDNIEKPINTIFKSNKNTKIRVQDMSAVIGG